MSGRRETLKRALCPYIKETLSHIDSVRGFCERLSTWTDARKTELIEIRKVTDQQELAAVLKDTLGGLQELHCFLDAVENLAVTSLHVFTVENPVLHLPEGIRPEHVQVVIFAARMICPLLLEFKRDASVFFLPKLQNVEVLSYQLNEYIQTTQKICEMLKKSSLRDFCLKMNDETLVDLDVDLSEDEMQRMLCHINQLQKIRVDQHFRMVFLFQEVSCSDFISEFSERRPRMLQSLEDLEQCAVQLDRMNKGAKISSVAGSSVGAAGVVMSIVGLLLIPVTAGVSLGLVIGGTALGITSGVNSAVTTATEIGVNSTYQNKASESFQNFMEDVQIIQDCLEEVSTQPAVNIELKAEYDKIFSMLKTCVSVGWKIKSLKTDVSAFKALQKGKALRNASRVSSEVSDIGQAAVKGTLALSNTARKLSIGLNALFIGMDVFFICKDSISLAKGSETEVSQLIRARATLWCSEIKSWQKICDFLSKGLLTSEKDKDVLETPFYPEREV
ncbi:apolipoprotein L6-like [Cebidichthys violaceus]|uniref:apolipoprotein L6-like n=1 Tax=Cebidichthys violaceus TaxID=271503 RepID=UPI0035C962A5